VAPVISSHPHGTIPTDACGVTINGAPCTHAYEWVIERRDMLWFMKACTVHRDEFREDFPHVAIVVRTRGEWEASGREAVLVERIRVAEERIRARRHN
jgi:hypothetical protein